jgi:hypothetical protein
MVAEVCVIEVAVTAEIAGGGPDEVSVVNV